MVVAELKALMMTEEVYQTTLGQAKKGTECDVIVSIHNPGERNDRLAVKVLLEEEGEVWLSFRGIRVKKGVTAVIVTCDMDRVRLRATITDFCVTNPTMPNAKMQGTVTVSRNFALSRRWWVIQFQELLNSDLFMDNGGVMRMRKPS